MNTSLHEEITVGASAVRALQVFTERCHDWWPRSYRLGRAERLGVVVEPRVGGRWYERTADGKESDWGKVLAWNPPKRLSLSWQIAVGFGPEPDPEHASRVEVLFTEASPTQTTIAVTHADFERHGDGWQAMRDAVAAESGWPGVLRAYAAAIGSGHGA